MNELENNTLPPTRLESEEIKRALSILVADDSVINQKIVSWFLEGRGHRVSTVRNGREAVAVLKERCFDIVLMDVEMPEMDGFEATALIRASESIGGWRTPIIAMTAHAMKSDRDRCLEADMDGYVCKPVTPAELFLAVDNATASTGVQCDNASHAEAIDWADVLELTGGDREFLAELISLFLDQKTQLLEEIRAAVRTANSSKLEHAAHALRGAVGNFSQKGAYDAAFRLEKLARSQRLSGAEETLADLENGMNRLQISLKSWVTTEFAKPATSFAKR
jgi:two-component system sensor histidine kinase/response regulator